MAKNDLSLLKIIDREEKQGFLDSAVMGGLSAYLRRQVVFLPKREGQALSSLADRYGSACSAERPAIWQSIKELLLSLPEEQLSPERSSTPVTVYSSQTWEEKPLAGLDISLQYVKGIGPKKAAQLRRLGLNTVAEVLTYWPRTYHNRGDIRKVASLAINEQAVISGEIVNVAETSPRGRVHVLKAYIRDDSGFMTAVWFNQRYLMPKMRPGRLVTLYGRLEYKYRQPEFMVQEHSFNDEEQFGMNRPLIPVYPLTEGVSAKLIRRLINEVWREYSSKITEPLPAQLLRKRGLMPYRQALGNIHFPEEEALWHEARRRLAYDELLLLQCAVLAGRLPDKTPGVPRVKNDKIFTCFTMALPFTLTGSQQKVIRQIFEDMNEPTPMSVLLQGDVGSGKTVVAAAALYKNMQDGYLGALMVPTEVLALQHYQSLGPLCQKLGMQIALLTGSLSLVQKNELQKKLDDGAIDVIIGTHALIQENWRLPRLGLAITDEQHRFGVLQRSVFSGKADSPDILMMTATPIPRTLALFLYGDMRLLVLNELPPGRHPVKTYAVSYDKEERVFAFIKKELDAGRQAYIVCPLINESEKLSLEAASVLAKRLMTEVLPGYSIAILHGKNKSAEKEDILKRFAAGKIKLLVSTTVIEVGINVPNATIMLIRDAERFGLAQLHQLRGRVGRGSAESYCILMHNALGEVAAERLKIITANSDGFAIAEADMQLRGPGELLGTKQHGLPELKIAVLSEDTDLLIAASEDARFILAQPNWQQTSFGKLIKKKVKMLYLG